MGEIRNKRVLDVGCNAGIISSCIDASNEITAIDANKDAVELAKKLCPNVKYIVSDFFKEKLPTGRFDAVVLAHALPKDNYASEHEPTELLKLIWGWLVPGGTLYLTTPNADYPYYRKKGKTINHSKLLSLLKEQPWEFDTYPWNPISIYLSKAPFPEVNFYLLKLLMAKKAGPGRCVSFFAIARKPAKKSHGH